MCTHKKVVQHCKVYGVPVHQHDEVTVKKCNIARFIRPSACDEVKEEKTHVNTEHICSNCEPGEEMVVPKAKKGVHWVDEEGGELTTISELS
jgi:hypothetical protein